MSRWVWNDARLAPTWHALSPFPHLVLDGLVPEDALPELIAIVEDEPARSYVADIYAFDATAPEPKTDAFRALRDDFARSLAPPLSRLSGKAVRRADMRAYAYRPGHHLLPHTDHPGKQGDPGLAKRRALPTPGGGRPAEGVGRVLAYAYYLPTPEPPNGGELELFTCRFDGDAIVGIESAHVIEPRANRLVVFEVSDRSLHQVREVLGGLRASLAGWFYP